MKGENLIQNGPELSKKNFRMLIKSLKYFEMVPTSGYRPKYIFEKKKLILNAIGCLLF